MAVVLLAVALAAVGTSVGLGLFDDNGGGRTAQQAGAAVPGGPATDLDSDRSSDHASRDSAAVGAGTGAGRTGGANGAASSTTPPAAPGTSPGAPGGSAGPGTPGASGTPGSSDPPSTSASAAPPASSPAAPTSSRPPTRPTTTSGAQPTKSPTSTGAAAFEDRVLVIVNNERAAAGCGPVRADSPLRDLARAHSKDMADRDYFSHNTPEGKTPWDRASAAGVNYLAAENIARGQQTPESVMDAWMNSDGHRRNILNCSFTKLGVGVQTGSGGPWWTQEFGR